MSRADVISPFETVVKEVSPFGMRMWGLPGESSEQPNFLLVHDPGPFPLSARMELCLWEVLYGLRRGGFNLGTLLYDQRSGTFHTVIHDKKRFRLDPPNPRLTRCAQKA